MKYLSMDEVIAIHFEVINKFGGKQGIHNFGLLHSTVERPRASFGGKNLYEGVFDKAAALLHSLILNYPLKDGNKRTAYIASARYLSMNGYDLTAGKRQMISFILQIERERLSIKKISQWLKRNSASFELF